MNDKLKISISYKLQFNNKNGINILAENSYTP